jgi:hypothetical protein
MFPTAGSHIYRNDAGEPMGWDSYSEPDPYDMADDYYSAMDDAGYDDEPEWESNLPLGDDGEPLRCEADIYGDGITRTRVVACRWRLRMDGTCPNQTSHLTD